MDMLALCGNGSGGIADGKYHGIGRNGENVSILIFQGNGTVQDFRKCRFQIYGNSIGFEVIPEIAGVGQTDSLGGDQVVLHFHDHGLFSLQAEIIGNLTSGQTAADDDNIFAHRFFAQQVFHSFHSGSGTFDRNLFGFGAGCHNDLICIQGMHMVISVFICT